MKNMHSYGYFRSEQKAEAHLKKMKKCDKETSKKFTYQCKHEEREKQGRKSWLAYRLEVK